MVIVPSFFDFLFANQFVEKDGEINDYVRYFREEYSCVRNEFEEVNDLNEVQTCVTFEQYLPMSNAYMYSIVECEVAVNLAYVEEIVQLSSIPSLTEDRK